MKKKFSKILSSLLILSFLISMFSVFSFADNTEEGSEEEEGAHTLFIHRTYDEGWAPNNGMSLSLGGNRVAIDHEEDLTNNFNYFTRFEVVSTSAASASSLTFSFGSDATLPGVDPLNSIVEFSIKTDDVAQLGAIANLKTQLNSETVKLIYIDEKQNIIAFPGKADYNLGKLENKWVNIGIVFDFTYAGSVSGTIYYGTGEGYQSTKDFNIKLEKATGGGINSLSFGFPKPAERSNTSATGGVGMTFCFDNLKIYSGTKQIQKIENGDYGSKIDRNAAKVVDIQKNAKDKSKAQLLNESLAMKVGVEYALVRSVKYPLKNNAKQDVYNGVYGAPQIDADGNVMVPLQLVLDYIGFPSYLHADKKSFDITTGSNVTNITLDRDTAVVDGVRVELASAPRYIVDGETSYIGLALKDIETLFPGWLTVYDDMGFILVYEDKTPDNTEDNTPILTRDNDLQTIIDIMKKFVFDKPEAENAEQLYLDTGKMVYDAAKANTTEFAHPYIMANNKTFEALKAAYAITSGQEGYDENLHAYIDAILAKAAEIYSENANLSGTSCVGIKADKVPVNPYLDGENPTDDNSDIIADTPTGYDLLTGRLDQIEEYAAILPVIALAYQITGNLEYAKFAYHWSAALASWRHWGPAYFDNCANATASIAISYDWLYSAYKSLGLDTDVIAGAIYRLGVHSGYTASTDTGDTYNTAKNDRNATGTYGMITGSLAILDYVDANEKRLSETLYLIGNNMDTLAKFGLDIYAPDGSYSETAKQWEKGTASFFRMVMALTSATGSDYGFMSTWGVDKTCYFGIYIESSDGFAWNYNDANGDAVNSSDTLESLNTDMFNFVGTYYGDDALIATRRKHIAAGKAVTVFDIISYPVGKKVEDANLSLDHLMEGIDAYVSRSDWEKGAMYVGLMGGNNSGNKAQLDSGNFVYYNKGIVWFMDLGGEDPVNASYANSSTRYKFYRACAEGQNVVYIAKNADVVYGQAEEGYGKIVSTFENEHGSYAILDNTNAYPTTLVSQAYRGLLVTNDRKTVVIQDEVSFVGSENVYWVAHTAHGIYIDPTTERTAYLQAVGPDSKTYTLRATIVTPSTDLKFSTLTAEVVDRTLANTADSEPVYKRDKLSRLVITLGDSTFSAVGSFNVSVVFEIVTGRSDKSPVGYEWVAMNKWEPATYDASGAASNEDANKRGPAVAGQIKSSTPTIVTALKKNNAFTERLESIYELMTLIEYTLKKYPLESLDSSYASFYGDYLDCCDKYEEFFDYVNKSVDVVDNLSNKLTGIVVEEEAEEPEE